MLILAQARRRAHERHRQVGDERRRSPCAHHRIANLKTHWPFVPNDAKRTDYRLAYRPKSTLDSIAFVALKDPTQFIDVLRLELAREYEAQGDHEAAYREYEALLRTNPYIAVNVYSETVRQAWVNFAIYS